MRSTSEKSNGLPLVVDTEFDPATCRLAIGRAEANSLDLSIRWVSGLVFDAGAVAAVGEGFEGLSVQMQRGARLMSYFDQQTVGRWDAQALAIELGGYLPWFLSDTQFENVEGAEFHPSEAIEMITEESRVDRQAILDALDTLIAACRPD